MGTRDEFDGESAAKYIRLTGLLVAVMCVLIAFPGAYFIPMVFGNAFRASTIPLLVLLPGTYMLCVAQVTDQVFTLIGRPGTASVIEVITLVFTVVGLAVALGPFGIAGAAAVSSLSYTLRFGLAWAVLRRAGLGSVTPRPSEWRQALTFVTKG